MASLLDLAEARLRGLLDIPTRAARAVVNPTAFSGLLGGPTLPREQGFAEGFAQLPAKTDMSVLEPSQAAYMQGYDVGVPYGLLASIAPFTKGMPVGASIKDVSKMSPYVPGVRAGEEMIVTHNLSPEKLYAAQQLGGMPVPSLAISKISDPLQNFGDITLIGSKEMAIPSKGNLAFRSDAYTARKPNIVYDMDYKSEQNLDKLFANVVDDIPKAQRDIGNIKQDFGRAKESTIMQAKFLKENNMLPKVEDFAEPWQQTEAIYKARQANQNAYDDWFDNFVSKLPDEGVKIKERIFKGFTPSGNRRYVEANLENIVKEMKGGAGSEGFNYGVGNLRAIATPRFKKFDDILKDRDRIVSEADFAPIKQQAFDNYSNLVNRLEKISNYRADDAILEAVETKSLSNLDRIYGDKLPKDLKADIGLFIKNLQKMPTEYFEIKPQRAVGIGEFKGALVPEDVSAKTMSILDQAGIREVYKYSSPQERKSLIERFGKEMFVGIPAIPMGLLGSEEQ